MSFDPENPDDAQIFAAATISDPVIESRRFGSGALSLPVYSGSVPSAAAQAVCADVRREIERGSDGIRRLAAMVVEFPWILRLPEMHAHLDQLEGRGERQAIARIIGAPHRGRPHDSRLHIVAIVDALRSIHGCSIKRACELAIEGADPMNSIRGIDVRTMRSRYSEQKARHDRYVGEFYVPGADLMPCPWSPGRR